MLSLSAYFLETGKSSDLLVNVNISSLSSLINLKKLEIEVRYDIETSLLSLGNLSNLESLKLENNKSNLEPLNSLKKLNYLDLIGNNSEVECITELVSNIKNNGGKIYGIRNNNIKY